MSLLNRLLKPDVAGGPQISKAYEASHAALAGVVPVAAFAPEGGALVRASDVAMGVFIPLHSHVALNAVLTDYVPPKIRGVTRAGLLGASALAAVGFLKLNLFGPGITKTVKDLWRH